MPHFTKTIKTSTRFPAIVDEYFHQQFYISKTFFLFSILCFNEIVQLICMHTCSIGIVKMSSPFKSPFVCAHILGCICFLISVFVNNNLSSSGYCYKLFQFLQTQNVLDLLKIKRRIVDVKINQKTPHQTMKMRTVRRFAGLTYLILALSLLYGFSVDLIFSFKD